MCFTSGRFIPGCAAYPTFTQNLDNRMELILVLTTQAERLHNEESKAEEKEVCTIWQELITEPLARQRRELTMNHLRPLIVFEFLPTNSQKSGPCFRVPGTST
ncbi:unnamed protein product [Haemonchus placei]|uniref:Uncharacterized protein n=1 Tax=Haemonchus placei TaxID=6290 RepID=A0A0N4XAW7_HAEPC|nr:unnamed protein product [Haemonchus placei]